MLIFQNISEFSEFQILRILIKNPENPVLLILRILILVKFKENFGIKLFRTQNCHFQEIKNVLLCTSHSCTSTGNDSSVAQRQKNYGLFCPSALH